MLQCERYLRLLLIFVMIVVFSTGAFAEDNIIPDDVDAVEQAVFDEKLDEDIVEPANELSTDASNILIFDDLDEINPLDTVESNNINEITTSNESVSITDGQDSSDNAGQDSTDNAETNDLPADKESNSEIEETSSQNVKKFESGVIVIISDTKIFKDENLTKEIGQIKEGQIAFAISRYEDESGIDSLQISDHEGTIVGYISYHAANKAEDYIEAAFINHEIETQYSLESDKTLEIDKPATEEETARQDEKTEIVFDLGEVTTGDILQSEESLDFEDTDQLNGTDGNELDFDIGNTSENVSFADGRDFLEKATESQNTEETNLGEDNGNFADNNKENLNEEVKTDDEQSADTEQTTEDELVLVARSGESEENAESEIDLLMSNEIDSDLLSRGVTGDTELSTGTTTKLYIPSGTNAKCFSYYTMEEAGLLTITFKSVSNAHGNVQVSIKDASDTTLWTCWWSKDEGTVNFSGFVEAEEYTVLIEKTDSTDDADYILSATPIVTRAGELGTLNNSRNNAVEIGVNAGSITGIVSLQDLKANRNDYYKFTLSSPGFTTISATNKTRTAMAFRLFGADTDSTRIQPDLPTATAAADINEMGTTTVNQSWWLDAGTYYIIAYHASSAANGRYELSVTSEDISITEKEKNDAFSQAYSSGNLLTLNGSEITGLLSSSESDGSDCYVFNLDSPTTVNFSLKVQFDGVNAAVFTREGTMVSGSSFGKTGIGGSEGNPYELELRKLLLDKGYYYVKVYWDDDSITPPDTGRYSISGTTTLTASTLKSTVSENNQKVFVEATVSGVSAAETCYLYFYKVVSGSDVLIDTMQFSKKSSIGVDYVPRDSGKYKIQFVATDGVTWSDKWDTFTITLPTFAITGIDAVAKEEGIIQCHANYSGNGKLQDSEAALYKNGVKIDYIHLSGKTDWTFTAPTAGTYSIQFAATNDGTGWKDGWTNVTSSGKTTILPLSVDSLSVSSTNRGKINCTAITKNGHYLQQVLFVLYRNGVEIKRQTTINSLTASFDVTSSGTYTVQCVAYDGVTWTDKWATVNVSIAAAAPLSVTSTTAKADADGNGIITMRATTQNGNPLQVSKFYIYRNSAIVGSVDAVNGVATATVYHSGAYTIQYVAYDGVNWKDGWATVTVTLNSEKRPITINSVTATSNASGAIKIDSTYTTGRPVQRLDYYVYNSANEIVNVEYTKGKTSSTLYVNNSGTYSIQVVGFDGIVWADMWNTVSVTIPGSSSSTLTISSVTPTITGPNSVSLEAVTNDSRALTYSMFWLYKNNVAVASVNAPLKNGSFSGLEHGTYTVQYVASDGKTWADKWTTVTIGNSTLAVNGLMTTMSSTASGNRYYCSASVTNNLPVLRAIYALYDASSNIVAQWEWDGTGDYLNHEFLLDPSITVVKTQYVVYDGVKWTDKWY